MLPGLYSIPSKISPNKISQLNIDKALEKKVSKVTDQIYTFKERKLKLKLKK